MYRAAIAYERPSRVSQGLIFGLSIAVVAMAGWLATNVMFFNGLGTMSGDEVDIQPTTAASYAASVAPQPTLTGATARANPADLEPQPWVSALDPATPPAAPAPPRSTLSLTPFAEFPEGSAPRPASIPPPVTVAPVATEAPGASYRSVLADELSRRIAEAAIDTTDMAPDVVPLDVVPLPKPRPAVIPVPRPRPQLDAEDAKPGSDQPFLDFLLNRER
jgi:hypothetical protein